MGVFLRVFIKVFRAAISQSTYEGQLLTKIIPSQKQSSEGLLLKNCSGKFRRSQMKTLAIECYISKAASLDLQLYQK